MPLATWAAASTVWLTTTGTAAPPAVRVRVRVQTSPASGAPERTTLACCCADCSVEILATGAAPLERVSTARNMAALSALRITRVWSPAGAVSSRRNSVEVLVMVVVAPDRLTV